jgi:LysR family glycine cleavage system transcriptional activator
MKSRLPNLPALLAFESAARHKSFSDAGLELDLDPATVSHRVMLLETQLACLLFERLPHKLKLTESGKAYLPTVRKAFEDLSVSSTDQFGANLHKSIAIRVPVSFGLLWLAPRLHKFREKHPEITVNFSTSVPSNSDRDNDVDVEIRFGLGHWDGFRSLLFYDDVGIPVCSPETVEIRGKVNKISDFQDAELIYVASMQDLWQRLFHEHDAEFDPSTSGTVVDTTIAALELVCHSNAYAIVPAMLTQHHLGEGSLVQAFPGETRIHASCYFVEPLMANSKNGEAGLFREWLNKELKESQSERVEAPSKITSLTDRLQDTR